MTEGYQGCTFLNSSRSRETETKCVKGKEEQRESKCEEEGEKKEKKRKEKNRLNLAIFLACAFLVALSIYMQEFSLNKLYKIVFKNSTVLLHKQ